MKNLQNDLKENYGLQALQLLWLWEKSVIREFDYKNHRIFTLWCISKDLVPVSVKLKTTCSRISEGARKIIEKAENNYFRTGSDVLTRQ